LPTSPLGKGLASQNELTIRALSRDDEQLKAIKAFATPLCIDNNMSFTSYQ